MKTCVQCHREFNYTVIIDNNMCGEVCTHPDCPNYGLLAIPQEDMPKEKDEK